ncbi:unnamed protein product [Sphagnum balticum]
MNKEKLMLMKVAVANKSDEVVAEARQLSLVKQEAEKHQLMRVDMEMKIQGLENHVSMMQAALAETLAHSAEELREAKSVQKISDRKLEERGAELLQLQTKLKSLLISSEDEDSQRNGGSAVDTREVGLSPMKQHLEVGVDGASRTQAVQSNDSSAMELLPKWPEQSDELLGLIVNSLRTLEEVVPQGVPEPQCRPKSVQKISLVLGKVPKHLQPDLIALVPKLIDFSK